MKPPTSILLMLCTSALSTWAWYAGGTMKCDVDYVRTCTSQIYCACLRANGEAYEGLLSQQRYGKSPRKGELQVFCAISADGRRGHSPTYFFLEGHCLEFCHCVDDGRSEKFKPSGLDPGSAAGGSTDSRGRQRDQTPQRTRGGARNPKPRYGLYPIRESALEGLDLSSSVYKESGAVSCEDSCSSFASCRESGNPDICGTERVCLASRGSAGNWLGLGTCVDIASSGSSSAVLGLGGRRDLATVDMACFCNSTVVNRECCNLPKDLV